MNINELKKQLLSKEHYDFSDLCNLVKVLRSEEGCPWDREQTNKSIRNSIIDETYEFIEGLDCDDDKLMCEELGDVLFQIVFHSDIKGDENAFDCNDVIDGISKKMILRHPHVFGNVHVENSAEVLVNWEAIKNDEKSRKTPYQQLDSVAKTLPSLMRAQKLRSKAAKNNLDVKSDKAFYIAQMRKALDVLEQNDDEKALGELLFAATGVGDCMEKETEEILYNYNLSYQDKYKN